MNVGGSTYYYHNDHLGTPQRMTDEAGNTVWKATYSAFGKATVDPASTVTNNLRYPGQYYDEETGLHYNYQRYYDPAEGRYVSVDPIGFEAGDENLYRYVFNGPLNGFDPEGLYDFGDFLYDSSNVLIGIGDTVSFGLTKKFRQKHGFDDAVDKCSLSYKGGQTVGVLIEMYLGGAGIVKGFKYIKTMRTAPEKVVKEVVDVTRRPSSFRKQTVQDAWDNAASGSKAGTKACPTCGKNVNVAPGKGRRDWDVDHQPKWKDRDLNGMDRKQVLDEYNKNVRLRCPNCNRSDN